MVKANAYGHGAVTVAQTLVGLGADYLAVASLSEALELRRAGIAAPILILGWTPGEHAGELVEHNLTQTVCDLETARAYSAAAQALGKPLTVHVKADTGMGRLGFVGENQAADILSLRNLPGLTLEGIFTHFSDADGDEAYTMAQFTGFLKLIDHLKAQGLTFSICHCAASSAVLHYPCTHLDMVRPGIALYGHYPDPESVGLVEDGLRPVMRLKTRVAAVRCLPAGSAISYGRTRILTRNSRLAVLPVGYADGLPRTLSNAMEVAFPSGRAPLMGRVCMDLCMVDVTALPEVRQGDVAEVFGAALPAEEKAAAAGTISYELLTAVAPRVPRVYLHPAGQGGIQ